MNNEICNREKCDKPVYHKTKGLCRSHWFKDWSKETGYVRKQYLRNKDKAKERKSDLRVRYRGLIARAKREKGFEIDFTFEQYKNFVTKPCHYCNGKLSDWGGGLDRLNSNKGYVLVNVVPCCPKCNRLKQDLLSEIEMLAVIKLLQSSRGNKIW